MSLRAADKVLAMGPGAVVIKKGEHGAHLFARDFQFISSAFALDDVLDPTGAGDTFAGGFMGYIASAGAIESAALKKAMVYGTVSASFTCERFSVERLRTLEIEEIRRRYNTLSDMTRFDRE